MSFIETCRQLVGLDSTPSRGTREIGEFAAQLCREANFSVDVDLESLHGLEQINLIARPKGPAGTEEVMLQTHLDTVDPGNAGAWTKTQANPFNASIYNDTLFGLGVADTKLDFLCKLEALKQLGTQNWRKNPVLVATYGAQLGMVGAIKLMRRKRVKAQVALIGEPTQLALGYAGQGLAVVEVSVPFSPEEILYRENHDQIESSSTQSKIFVGKAAHSSEPDLGQNAIVKMLDYLVQLPAGIAIMDLDGGNSYNRVPESAVLEIDVVGSLQEPIVPKIAQITRALRHMDEALRAFPPDVGGVRPTVNIGTIRTFPDHVRLTGSCRLPPSVTDKVYESWIATIKDECAQVGATFSVRDYKAAFRTEPNAAIVQAVSRAIRHLGSEPNLVQVPTSTEANVFSRFGMDCIVIGPGQGVGNSHAANESVKIDELNRAIEFYKQTVRELCL